MNKKIIFSNDETSVAFLGNGKIDILDKSSFSKTSYQISFIGVELEYPEKRLGTIELSKVLLHTENRDLIFQDNDIIGVHTYFDKNEIIEDLAKKYNVNPAIIKIL